MNVQEFHNSLLSDNPPENVSPLVKALWYEGRGNWETAHQIVQTLHSNRAYWIHAYLHRKHGDLENAKYW